jgi:hypothetical protein
VVLFGTDSQPFLLELSDKGSKMVRFSTHFSQTRFFFSTPLFWLQSGIQGPGQFFSMSQNLQRSPPLN